MKVYKKVNQNLLRICVEVLGRDGVIIAPTDTVYGVLAAMTEKGAEKIFLFKGRKKDKPLGVFVSSCQDLETLVKVKKEIRPLIEELATLPTTFILEKKIKTPKGVGTDKTLGVRVARNPFLQKLLKMYSGPILQTSANISGEKPATEEREVLELITKAPFKPDVVLIQGNLSGLPSTVIDFTKKEPEIIREGAMADKIRTILKGYLGPKLKE